MIQRFEKENLKTLRHEINSALKRVSEAHGITFKLGNITYNDFDFHAKLEAFAVSDPEDINKLEYVANCYKFGLKVEWYGKEVQLGSQKLKIVGIYPRGRKWTVKAEKMDGSICKIHHTDVMNYFRYIAKLSSVKGK